MFLFNRSNDENSPYKNIDAGQYREQFNNGTPYTLVDVREPEEFSGGRLPGAVNIPLGTLRNKVNTLPKDQPIIVVCATGNRSRSGATIIAGAGYDEVYNLKGGTMTWMMKGFPIER